MPGYVYKGNDFSIDPMFIPHKSARRSRTPKSRGEVTSNYIIDTTRNRSVQRLVKAHQKESDKIKRVIISEYFGKTYDAENGKDYRLVSNMMKMVLVRKYPREFEEIKRVVRAEVEKEFDYKPKKVGEHGKKSQYDEFIQKLVDRDFT